MGTSGQDARMLSLDPNPQPGFEVTFDTPPGRHRLALEAQLEDGEWRSILNVPVWCRPAN